MPNDYQDIIGSLYQRYYKNDPDHSEAVSSYWQELKIALPPLGFNNEAGKTDIQKLVLKYAYHFRKNAGYDIGYSPIDIDDHIVDLERVYGIVQGSIDLSEVANFVRVG